MWTGKTYCLFQQIFYIETFFDVRNSARWLFLKTHCIIFSANCGHLTPFQVVGRGMHVAYIHKYTGEQKCFAIICHPHWYISESGPQSTPIKCLEKSPDTKLKNWVFISLDNLDINCESFCTRVWSLTQVKCPRVIFSHNYANCSNQRNFIYVIRLAIFY